MCCPGRRRRRADGAAGGLESAAVEQVAVWYQQRDKLGLIRHWPKDGIYLVFSQLPLLPQVSAILRPYRRWVV